jgi:hypothetical protein
MVVNEDFISSTVPLNGLHLAHTDVGECANIEVALEDFESHSEELREMLLDE